MVLPPYPPLLFTIRRTAVDRIVFLFMQKVIYRGEPYARDHFTVGFGGYEGVIVNGAVPVVAAVKNIVYIKGEPPAVAQLF